MSTTVLFGVVGVAVFVLVNVRRGMVVVGAIVAVLFGVTDSTIRRVGTDVVVIVVGLAGCVVSVGFPTMPKAPVGVLPEPGSSTASASAALEPAVVVRVSVTVVLGEAEG